MSNLQFVHLHNHSEYSLLDGLSPLADMVKRAAHFNQPAIALTDHGVLYGAIDFYELALEAGIKPIIGVEGYMAHNTRDSRVPAELSPFHITVLVANIEGYRNLNRLITTAHLHGFYKRPRFDWSDLEKHHEGLIVLSGCLSGEIMENLKAKKVDDARATALKFKELLGDRYFFEIMRHKNIAGQEDANKLLVELAKDLNIPLVATNDSHYVERNDASAHDALLCIQTNKYLSESGRLKFDSDEFYLRSGEEMRELFSDIPEAVDNTLRVAEMVDLKLELGGSLTPKFPVAKGKTAMEYLRELCDTGCRDRFGDDPPQAVTDRLQEELSVIEYTNYADYFLVCWDIFQFVHRKKILSAVRGSAAASLVLYCLKVTEINPLEYTLVFERFLNRERREMPDIDMDFEDDRREEVIRYCADKYGEGHIAQIVTFGTLGPRLAVRDVARILELGPKGDELANMLSEGPYYTPLKESAKRADIVAKCKEDKDFQKILELAQRLEGRVRHASTHAAGVVISQKELTDYIALRATTAKDGGGPPTTQCAMYPVARIGLLKMDFLGLRNLGVIARTIKSLQAAKSDMPDIYDIPLDDKPTFEVLAAGDTFGVFQLESDGMTNSVRKLKPASIAEIAALIALYRPGPMEHIDEFVAAKHKKRDAQYPHENLRHILEETYGVIVYQDQILLIAREFGGYTLGEADVLRKAMGKKIPAVMKAEHDRFLEGAQKQGYSKELAERLFNLIEPFAGYAFNKAHSVSYAMIAYWTAYFKANHRVEYFAALFDSQSGDQGRVAANIASARRLGIEVLPPNINISGVGFQVTEDGKALRLGLSNIKGFGRGSAEEIVTARSDKKFESLDDLCRRVTSHQLSRATLEVLIKAGGLDDFGAREALVEKVDELNAFLQEHTKLSAKGQETMFNLFGEEVGVPLATIEVGDAEADKAQRHTWEQEALGIALTARDKDTTQKGSMVADLGEIKDGAQMTLQGRIGAIKKRTDRNGETYLKCSLSLADGSMELTVWSSTFKRTRDYWTEGNFVEVAGRVEYWRDAPSLTVARVTGDEPKPTSNGAPAMPLSQTSAKTLTLSVKETGDPVHDKEFINRIFAVLLDHSGNDLVEIEVAGAGKFVKLQIPDRVATGPQLEAALTGVLNSAATYTVK